MLIAMGIIILGGMLVFYFSPGYLADEAFHTLQIKRIYRADHRFVPELTTIPGYHYAMSYMSKVTSVIIDYGRHPKTKFLRIFQTMTSLLLPLIIYGIVRELKQKREIPLVALLIPIVFPFLFLVYTDLLSMTLFLGAFLFHIKKRYDLAGLFMLLDIVVRQDNVIWLFFLITLLFYETYQKYRKINKQFIRHFFVNGIAYCLVLFLFVGFYIFNGGVAIGDKSAHPSMRFHASNVWLFFAMFSVMFLPLIVLTAKKIWLSFRKKWFLYVWFIIGGYFLFIQTYSVDHPYNASISKFIHNNIAHHILHSTWLGIVTYGLVLLAIGYLFTQSFINKKYILVVIFGILSLALHWMIEFRYFFIPMVLLLLVLNHDKKTMNYQIIYGGVLSLMIFYYLFFYNGMFL